MPTVPKLDSHGHELRSCRLGDIRFSEVAMPPRLRLHRHRHAAGQVVFVLEGWYRERWQGRAVDLGPGSVLYRPPGQAHANRFGGDEVLALVVAYDPARLAALGAPRGPGELRPVLRHLRGRIEREWRRGDAASRAALEGIALLLLARAWRDDAAAGGPDWLAAALAFLRRRWADGPGLAEVAGEVGRHRATVAAGFRRALGRSVGEVVRELRLEQAIRLIEESRRPLAEIAVECGYYDQSHMGRRVKRATGATPMELRRSGS